MIGTIGSLVLQRGKTGYGTTRRRADRRPVSAIFEGVTTEHPAAVVLAALPAALDRQPVDRLTYRRNFRTDDHVTEWSADDYRSELNASLGTSAHTVGPSLTLLQEVLAQRALVGPELWQHQLEDRMADWGLPMEERARAGRYVEQILAFETRLVSEGVLVAGDRITTLVPIHWANAIRLLRVGHRAGVLDTSAVEHWMGIADGLVNDAFGPQIGAGLGVLFASQLLPVHLSGDDTDFERRLRLVKEMLPTWCERFGVARSEPSPEGIAQE